MTKTNKVKLALGSVSVLNGAIGTALCSYGVKEGLLLFSNQ